MNIEYKASTLNPIGDEHVEAFSTEGISRILIPTNDLLREINYFSSLFDLKVQCRDLVLFDSYLDNFAILASPNGMVLELVTPKQQYANLFRSPIYYYTAQNLLSK